ncbi:MAG TPA: GspE/PulE family protein [Sedimentisphaerales bacterium]|nr:GspE/PulE family protein [Sedimentisphaerales bacterium]
MQTLVFSPIKLALLIGWFFLCFWLAQRTQYSLLVPKDKKISAALMALLLGPIAFLIFLFIDLMKKSAQSQSNMIELLKEFIANIFKKEKEEREEFSINLFDSSGRNLKEIYSHGKSSRDLQVLDLTTEIIWKGLELNASDILIDPKDDSVSTVRLRIDGVLRIIDQLETDTCQAVVNSIKAVANMDIAERRRPQDGAFTAKTITGNVSFRVASAGALNGEKLSIRVLNQNANRFRLDNIGISKKQAIVIQNAMKKPSGMILMCGPTGSGKTTTMYGMLNEIDFNQRNVITVEDPIEYVLPQASQIEVNAKADITFAKSLRSILRQDPDVICVGEIRDEDTAAIALRASQTGHLVLATIHSNSNAATIVRLMDLGISPLLIATGLSTLISQRLVRKLCENCKRQANLSQAQILSFKKNKVNYLNIYEAVGCEKCHGTGYLGRIAICDILDIDDNLRTLIANEKLDIGQLRKNGDEKGKSNLQKQGLKKVVEGITSLDELKRVLG